MVLNEICLNLLMTACADSDIESNEVLLVAIGAAKNRPIRLCLVRGEGISKIRMDHIGLGQISQRPAMLQMAFPTQKARAIFFKVSVQRGRVESLGTNIRMADHTTVGHGYLLEQSTMTGETLPTEGCVRGDPSQRLPGFRIERAGAEKRTTPRESHPDNDENCQETSDHAGRGQTTETVIVH